MWPPGTIVVCVNNKGLSTPSKFNKPLQENEYYTIRDMIKKPFGIRFGVRLNEIQGEKNHDGVEWAFKAERFRIAESTHDEKEIVCQLTNSST